MPSAFSEVYLFDELRRRGFEEDGRPFAVRAMTDAYFTLCRTDLTEDRSELDEETWNFYKKNRDYIDHAGNDIFKEALVATRNEFFMSLSDAQTPPAYNTWLPTWARLHEEKDAK